MEENNKKIKISIIVISSIIAIILILLYISNKNYVNRAIFELNGDKYVFLFQNEPWTDPGVKASKNGADLNNYVTITSNYDNKISGNYKIIYTLKKGLSSRKLERTITVKEGDYNSISFNLIGGNNIYLLKNKVYKEPGFTAIDKNEGDLSKNVVVTGQIDNTLEGSYTLNYYITNKLGISKMLTRTVIVYSLNYTLTSTLNQEEGYIIFNTNDRNFKYLLNPNGEIIYDKTYEYKISQNGKYQFRIFDQNGSYVENIITIDKFDKEAPKGTCTGYLYDNYTILQVDATDDTGVTGYLYQYGNNKTAILTQKTYKYSELINEATVTIYDQRNNMTTINCNMIDKSTLVAAGYKSYSFKNPDGWRVMKYWLYIPKNLHIRTKIPMMIYLHGDGGRTENINDVNKYAFPYFVAHDGYEYPFIMLAPQCDSESNWTGETTYKLMLKLVEYLKTIYNIDEDRIILSGGSSGGRGAYVIAAMNKNYFSSVVTGSATCEKKYAKYLTDIPIWAFNGTADSAVSYSSAQSFINEVNNNGGNATLTTIVGGTHGITEEVFRRQDLIEWMIKQKRK